MSTINPLNTSSNPQLAGIVNSVPFPAAVLNPNSSVAIGADGGGFSLSPLPQPGTTGASSTSGGGQVIVGGGDAGTPANGAQPAGPNGVGTSATTTTPTITVPTTATPTTASSQATPENGSPLAHAISGFGKANRSEPIKAEIDGATFGFPSFKATSKQLQAPAIQWGPGWKKVEKNGMWWMEHANGSKAVPAVEYRITPKPADKVQSIRVANGWGKKFPDGSLLIFDRKEGPYRLDPKGNKHKVGLGTITIGGVKVRVFEASVVRTMDKDGKVDVFDSRGNVSKGSTRWNTAAPVGAAAAGATMGGGATDGGGKTEAGGAPGKLVGGGISSSDLLTKDVETLTGLAREIVNEIRSGNVDPARLASLQAQLSKLPSGILQAAGAAGTMASDGTTVSRPSTEVGGVTGPPAAGSTDGGGTTTAAPTPGVDANATTKDYPAGTVLKLDASAIPSDLADKQARFGQLPEELQLAIAKGFGSDQGVMAFQADQLLSFGKDGSVKLQEAGTVYLRHQAQVRGAGPGEDRTLTMRPNRQPGSTGSVSGGGATTSTPTTASGSTGGHAAHAAAGAGGTNGTTTAGGGQRAPIALWKPGGETRHVDFGGLNGTYTWKSLPARARTALLEILRSGDEEASKAFASRSGGNWVIDPGATIVIDAGFASFPSGLSMIPAPAAPTRPSAAGGPSTQPVGHDATRPPVSGGGGGTVSPSMAPPVPAVNDPGEGAHVHHH